MIARKWDDGGTNPPQVVENVYLDDYNPDYYCDLCVNDEHRPVTEDWVSPKGRLFGFLCPKCQEFVIEREAMTPEQLAREAASIRAYQEEMRRSDREGKS